MIAALSLVASAAIAAAYVPPPPPPGRLALSWIPGTVQCDRVTIAASAVRRPTGSLIWPGVSEGGRTLTYRFRIDAAGRPLSIMRTTGGMALQTDDIAPSLAASRFPAGAAQADCTITYTGRARPIPDAPVADLMAYAITTGAEPLPPAGRDRIVPAGSTCLAEPRPRILLRAYPDFLALPRTPGVANWSMVGYDLDARGRPIHVRTVGGTQHAPLDAAAVKAVRASRFTRGARTGCVHPYRQAADPLPAPPIPDHVGAIATAGHCPTGDAWAYYPPPVYPEPWRRRGVEGWAVIGFDVAPWGELGNLRVIASEPAAEFGTEAVRLLRGARKPASTSGASGCVDRVRFVMRRQGSPDPPAAPMAD